MAHARSAVRRSPWEQLKFSPVRVPRSVLTAGGELAATVAVVYVYFLIRGSHPDDVPESVNRTIAIVDMEQRFHLFQEATIQHFFLGQHWVVNLANMIYVWGMYPTLTSLAAWLAFKDIGSFRYARNLLLVSAVMGLAGYWLIPAAPPRLLGVHGFAYGFVDTLHSPTSAVKDHQLGTFRNDYAALPSFHFAWIALAAVCVWCNTRWTPLRVLAVCLPVVMFWAIIVTANHLFFDLVLGVLTVVVAWLITKGLYHLAARVRGTDARERGAFRRDDMRPTRRRNGTAAYCAICGRRGGGRPLADDNGGP